MSDPYEVLGIDPACDDAEIRRRYLELVRQFPPEHHPERFAAVREAYEQVRDPVLRLEARLFPVTPHHTIDAILVEVEGRLRNARISTKTLLSLAE